MTDHAADDFAAIAARMRELRSAEGGIELATDTDLDAHASRRGVTRRPYESDDALRARVVEEAQQ